MAPRSSEMALLGEDFSLVLAGGEGKLLFIYVKRDMGDIIA